MATKAEFMAALDGLMRDLPGAERARLIDYFSEMIDDRIEMGMPEADAVAALGDPAALLRDVCPEPSTALPAVQAGGDSDNWSDAIREIQIHTKSADVHVLRRPLPGGMTAQIKASQSNCFTWRLEEGVLTVSEVSEVRRVLFQKPCEITLILPELNPVRLIMDSYAGDLEVDGIEVMELTVLSTSSGDIALRRFKGRGRTEVTSRSGDIDVDTDHSGLTGSDFAGQFKLETLSGDIEIKRATVEMLRARTASGDIDLRYVRGGDIALRAVSGDIEASDVIAAEAMACETTSGDIDLDRLDAANVRAASTSGDLSLGLRQRVEGFDIQAETKLGDLDLPEITRSPSAARAVLRTVNGDIHVRIV